MGISDSEDDLEQSESFYQHGKSSALVSVFFRNHAGAVDVTSLSLKLGVADVQTDSSSRIGVGTQADNYNK